MSEWKEYKLGDIAKIKGGKRLPKGENLTEIPTNHPYIRTRDINNCKIAVDELLFVPENVFPSIYRYIVENQDIILSIVGTIGLCAIIPLELHNASLTENCAKLVNLKEEIVNRRFLFYYFISPDGQEEIEVRNVGSTQPKLPLYNIKDIPVLLPPLPEQRAIASVLSSLDDKIDLLHRENKTLEAMAEALFRQWFIEEANDGWEEVPLGNSDLAKIIKSGIDYFEGEKIYLATGDIENTDIRGGTSITFKNRPSRANMKPVIHSVWFAKKGGVRKLLMFDDYSYDLNNLILSTGFTGLKTTNLSHYYIWCYIMSTEFQEIKDSFVSGTVQPDINNEGVNQIMVPRPDNKTLLRFNEIVKEFFFKISFNQRQIRTLEKLRDTLLPKLMSGEVRVAI